jgi:hypothetical protein
VVFLPSGRLRTSSWLLLDEPENRWVGMIHPDQDDVVVRERRGNPHVVYLLGTPTTPDQFSLRTREEAVTQAIAFARRQRVRAWFDNADNTFLLLGTFRIEE